MKNDRTLILFGERKCLYCGQIMLRKRWSNGQWEARSGFAARVFCDLKCANEYTAKFGRYIPPEEGRRRTTMNRRARKFLKKCCERCLETKGLEIHHKDRDWRNNDPSNLETLCHNCHRKEHIGAGDFFVDREPCRICGQPYNHDMGSRGDLCNKHRLMEKRHGDASFEKMPLLKCSVPKCENQAYLKGYCEKHYLRWRRHGDPEGGSTFREYKKGDPCRIDGCDKLSHSLGYCNSHYLRFRRHGHPEGGRKSPET